MRHEHPHQPKLKKVYRHFNRATTATKLLTTLDRLTLEESERYEEEQDTIRPYVKHARMVDDE